VEAAEAVMDLIPTGMELVLLHIDIDGLPDLGLIDHLQR
jgi:hypothetical protein